MNKQISGKHAVFSILLVAILFLIAIPAASAAFTATLVSPVDPNANLASGNVIAIQVNGLAVGDSFTYRLTSSDLQTAGNTITLANVNMPFGFRLDGTTATHLRTSGVSAATLTVKRLSDATELSQSGTDFTKYWNIKKDSYDVSITGTKTASSTGIDYSVAGTVADAGTNPSTLSLTLANVNSGHLTLEILDGAVSRYSQTFTIAVPDTNPSGGSDSGPSAPSAPAAAPAVGPQAQLAPAGVSATSVTIQHNEEGKSLASYSIETDPAAGFSSSLDISTGTTAVTAAGQPVSTISVTPLDPATAPEVAGAQGAVYSFSGLSVECEPSGAQFTGGAVTISFSMTPAQWADALGKVNGNTASMTVNFYDTKTNTWQEVPTTVDPVTHTVSAQITHFTTYAVLYKSAKEAPAISPPTFGSLVSPTPAGAAGTGAPAPVNTMQAPPETTKSPGLPGIVVIGIIGFVGLLVVKKKQ
jgi:hypothetical protein